MRMGLLDHAIVDSSVTHFGPCSYRGNLFVEMPVYLIRRLFPNPKLFQNRVSPTRIVRVGPTLHRNVKATPDSRAERLKLK